MIFQCPNCRSRYQSSIENPDEFIQCRCGTKFVTPHLPKTARSWHCPNCSGVVDPSTNRCEYCDSYLAFSRCPSCYEIAAYDEAQFCAECGESLTLPIRVPEHQGDKECPRCDGKLKSKLIDKNHIDVCDDCGGVWLEQHLLESLLEKQSVSITALLNQSPSTNRKLVNHDVTYLPCPECNTIMNRHNFMGNSYVILDQCYEHGLWFDKNELGACLEFYSSSNLNKSNNPKKILSNRKEDEVFEITEEDLSELIKEFPHWVKNSN